MLNIFKELGERKRERKKTRGKKEIREQPKNPHKPYKPTAGLLSIRRITGYPRLLLNARSNGKSSARENCFPCNGNVYNCLPTFYQFERDVTPALNQTQWPLIPALPLSTDGWAHPIQRGFTFEMKLGVAEDERRRKKARKRTSSILHRLRGAVSA